MGGGVRGVEPPVSGAWVGWAHCWVLRERASLGVGFLGLFGATCLALCLVVGCVGVVVRLFFVNCIVDASIC